MISVNILPVYIINDNISMEPKKMNKKKKALIVEDEAIIRLNLKLILTQLNCVTVGETSKGEEAVDLARQKKPDFIFMDIKLQGMIDGIETAKRICDFLNVPIIFMSTYSIKEKENLLNFKNDIFFLVKPIQKEQIADAIKSLG